MNCFCRWPFSAQQPAKPDTTAPGSSCQTPQQQEPCKDQGVLPGQHRAITDSHEELRVTTRDQIDVLTKEELCAKLQAIANSTNIQLHADCPYLLKDQVKHSGCWYPAMIQDVRQTGSNLRTDATCPASPDALAGTSTTAAAPGDAGWLLLMEFVDHPDEGVIEVPLTSWRLWRGPGPQAGPQAGHYWHKLWVCLDWRFSSHLCLQ